MTNAEMINPNTIHRPVSQVSATDLPIVETFHSIQGEGFWAGTNAFFIRLAGCDVGCPWCDTKHSWNPKRHPRQEIAALVTAARAANPQIVVITGGEPLMHDLTELTRQLKAANLQVNLETSGAHPFSGKFDWVTFSPKRSKAPHPSIYAHANELKVVIADESDLEWAEQQAAHVPDAIVKLLQPEWQSLNSQDIVFNYVLKHPQWRVSLQTHKFLGVQ
ncbi:MAG: 7-carboxy-7-deazaguanine synthase QueE [Thainema sp.]